ncbi:MAG TPA: carboxylesterase family protein [Pseudonocardia sp.]
MWDDGVAVFRGIPFAAPPIGPNRFAAPRPAFPWDGVRDASRFGSPPPQPGRRDDGGNWLTLAVWTPEPGRSGSLPVVVWISGGAYLNCDSADPYLTGRAVAAAGAVVVSGNYRTGVEGFARLHGAPDNRGLLDQVAVLRWVQDNIAGFGGDPATVTVLGQSAGAASIAALVTMPAAAGLVRRAILQSVPGTFLAPDLATDIATDISAELGRSASAEDLAPVAPNLLVDAASTVTRRLARTARRWGPLAHTPSPFAPVVDGEILPLPPWSAHAGGAARSVELLVGHVRDEFRLAAARLDDADDAAVTSLINGLAPTPGARRYRAAFASASPNALRETAMADWLMRMPTLHLAEAAHAGGARVWLYELCWGFGPQGASHALDTLLVFGTADIEGEVTAACPDAVATAGRLSELMRAEHLAFAAAGDPGWPRYRPHDRRTRVYDAESTVAPYPEERSRELWRAERFGALGLDLR